MLLSGCGGKKIRGGDVKSVSSQTVSDEGVGWGFVRKKGKPPEIREKDKELLKKYDCYYIGENSGKTLFLTFDEGYENGYTSKILDVLQKTETPAAFFVTGPYLENQQELVKRMIDEGHIVGNHTVNHPNLPKQDNETIKKEIDDLSKKCEEIYGVSMKYMRPPEGEYSERVLSLAQGMGYKTILWSFAYKDWDINMQQGADYAFSQVTPYLHDGAVILLHAVSSDNANALEDIINYAKKEGFEFKSLDELQ
jgi:peptidoglycan-N-acetylmuramic acid deacetylase